MTDCNECRHQRHSAFGTWCEVDHSGFVYGPSGHGCTDFERIVGDGVERIAVGCVAPGGAPCYAHDGDAGCDLRAAESVTILPGGSASVGTGLRIALPDTHYARVTSRSGLMFKSSVVAGPGTIDSGYRGEVRVMLFNLGDKSFRVGEGDRIAQLVIGRRCVAEFRESGDLGESERGTDGFGSTGVR